MKYGAWYHDAQQIINRSPKESGSTDHVWLDLERLAQVEVTSEETRHPVESALTTGGGLDAKGHPDIVADPAPVTYFDGFGGSALNFRLHCWTHNYANWLSIQSDIVLNIHDALKEAGISIPFPQRDMHIRSTEHAASEAIPPKKNDF